MNVQYSGEERIPVPAATVWAFVQDPERIGRCLPDVVDLVVHDPTHFDAIAQVALGPMRGKLKFAVELVPNPSMRRIDMKIAGGGYGSSLDLTAGADVIEMPGGTTLLRWSGHAVARGAMVAMGRRMLDAQAKKLVEQAFANVRQRLST